MSLPERNKGWRSARERHVVGRRICRGVRSGPVEPVSVETAPDKAGRNVVTRCVSRLSFYEIDGIPRC